MPSTRRWLGLAGALLLLALAGAEEDEAASRACLERFLQACERTWAAPPQGAEIGLAVVAYEGDDGDLEGLFDGPYAALPLHGYKRLEREEKAQGARRVRDAWRFQLAVSSKEGDKAPKREECEAWKRGRSFLRRRAKDWDSSAREFPLEPAEALKDLVALNGGKLEFRARNPRQGWRQGGGDTLVWSCSDADNLERLAVLPSTAEALEGVSHLPGKPEDWVRGSLEVRLAADGRIACVVRKVAFAYTCRESHAKAKTRCPGCRMPAGETLTATYAYEASPGGEPEIPEAVARKFGWETK